MLPKGWKKSFNIGVIIPTKMSFCKECNDLKVCNKCDNQITENIEPEENLILLEKHAANEFGYMFPYNYRYN